jgi:hypothetical protein
MKKYYVNNNGDHEVHEENCNRKTSYGSYKDLGYHHNCQSAVIEAQKTYPTADGCYYCCNECHTT